MASSPAETRNALLAKIDSRIAALECELRCVVAILEDNQFGCVERSQLSESHRLRFRDPFGCKPPNPNVQRIRPPLSQDEEDVVEAQAIFPHPLTRVWRPDEDRALDAAVLEQLQRQETEDVEAIDWLSVSDAVGRNQRAHYAATDKFWLEGLNLVPGRHPESCKLRFLNGLRCWRGSVALQQMPFTSAENTIVRDLATQLIAATTSTDKLVIWERVGSCLPGRTPFQVATRIRTEQLLNQRSRFSADEDVALLSLMPQLRSFPLVTAQLNLTAFGNGGPSIVVRLQSEVESRCRALGIRVGRGNQSVLEDADGGTLEDAEDDQVPYSSRFKQGKIRRTVLSAKDLELLRLSLLVFGPQFALIADAIFGDELPIHTLRRAARALV
jgi:hypothetical protein